VGANWENQLLSGYGKITKQPNIQDHDGSPKEHQLLQGLYNFLHYSINLHPAVKDTVQYDKKAGSYWCQLDEQWFVLTKDTLREALQITPANNNQAFIALPSSDALINFVNELGYPKRHRFHPRPDSPLHLPNEEPVLGYLKFSAKGTKREVFEMPIPSSLITADIQEASYYQEYLKMWPIIEGKKRSLKSVAASEAEDVPAMEPHVAAEDADLQKTLEESMKTAYAPPRGPLPPVVIREPESRQYQPLLEVPGKGKAKVTEEQSDNEEESKKVVLGADEGGQSKGQAGLDLGAQAEGQTGSDAAKSFSCVLHFKELVQDLAEARKKKKKSHESPKTPPRSPPHQPPPPPPPPPAGPSRLGRLRNKNPRKIVSLLNRAQQEDHAFQVTLFHHTDFVVSSELA
nr:histone deacetylase 14 [Tanacetum cinerariifolium]